MNEEETGIKVSIPIITNKELEDISKNYDNYIDDIVKAVVHEKDMVILQTIIKEQKSRIEKLQQELQQEKEKNKKLEEEKQQFVDSYTKTMDELGDCAINSYNQKKFYEKVIDMVAKDIADNNISEDICRQFKMKDNCYKDNTYDDEECGECIKRYYFKKARGEENENSSLHFANE